MRLHNNSSDTIWSGDFIVEINGKIYMFEYFNVSQMFLYDWEEGRDENHTFIGDNYLWSDADTYEYRRFKDGEYYKWLKSLK